MFVVTEDLKEFIEEMKKLGKMLRDPRLAVATFVIGLCLLFIYFGCIILADLLNL